MKKIGILLPLLCALTMLSGCLGKSSGSTATTGQSQVRLVNLASSYPSLDMIGNGAVIESAVTPSAAGNFVTVNAGTYTLSLNVTSTGTAATNPYNTTFGTGLNYSILAFPSGQSLQILPMPETQAAPASGYGNFRVSVLSPEIGGSSGVYVYMAPVGGNPFANSLFPSGFSQANPSFFTQPAVPGGSTSYHIVVTGTDISDVKLDLPSVAIADQQTETLYLTSAAGGSLADGWLLTQGGSLVFMPNKSARIRVVGDFADNVSVTATANTTNLGPIVSPSLGSYSLISSGPLSLTVNGKSVTSITVDGKPITGNYTVNAGSDLTLLVAGTSASPQYFLFNDNNNIPVGGLTNLRLVNGFNGLANNVTLSLAGGSAHSISIGAPVAFGQAGTPASKQSSTLTELDVLYPGSSTPLVQFPATTLTPGAVYTVFILGSTTAPQGFLQQDNQ